jgi:hypothetical protein
MHPPLPAAPTTRLGALCPFAHCAPRVAPDGAPLRSAQTPGIPARAGATPPQERRSYAMWPARPGSPSGASYSL